MNNQILIEQIVRLCEKQFRKGYQHGFSDCKNNLISEEEVEDFRLKGSLENYKNVINPIDNYEENALERLLMELNMPDMAELKELIS